MSRLVLVALALLASPGVASAAIMSYADLTSWSAAVTGVTLVDLAPFQEADGAASFASGFTASGVSFRDPNESFLYVMSPAYGGPPEVFPNGGVLGCNECGGGGGIEMLLPAGTTAVSFSGMSWYRGGAITVRAEAETLSLVSFVGLEVGFLGITSSTPLGAIQVDVLPIGNALIGDIRYGSASQPAAAPVPEPGSLLLLASGVLGLVGCERRTRRKRAP